MFFSRVRIETGAMVQARLLKECQGDLYAIHQLLWKLFPDDSGGRRPFLFRQEIEKEQLTIENTRRGLPLFYVVSQRAPVPVNGLLNVDIKEYCPKIKAGTRLSFDVRVNPVIARKTDGKENSVKHDVSMDAKHQAKARGITDSLEIASLMQNAVSEWFLEKGNVFGFQPENSDMVEITSYRQHLLRKGSNRIRFSSVDLTGVLRVVDSNLFEKALFNGIGSAKAFGCGLLLVKPLQG